MDFFFNLLSRSNKTEGDEILDLFPSAPSKPRLSGLEIENNIRKLQVFYFVVMCISIYGDMLEQMENGVCHKLD